MRILLAALLPAASCLQIPDLQPFLAAIPQALQDFLPAPVSNASASEVLNRRFSNTCPSGFDSCQNLGAPGLCCQSDAVCSPDQSNNVACCPSGAVCTGVVSGVISQGTIGSNGELVSATGSAAGAVTTSFQLATGTAGNGLVQASTQTPAGTDSETTAAGGGFIIDGTSTVASPGAALRGAQPPAIARAIIHLLQYLPI